MDQSVHLVEQPDLDSAALPVATATAGYHVAPRLDENGDWWYLKDGTWEKLALSEAITDTTDGETLEWGKQYWLHPAFNYNFPAVTQTANDNWMRGYPSNFDWRAFTGTWTGSGTDTIGAGQQPLAALSDAVTFIGSLGTPSNISMHVGGGSAAEVGLPAYVNLADAQGAGIAGRLFRATGTGNLLEGAYFMDATNTPVGPFS